MSRVFWKKKWETHRTSYCRNTKGLRMCLSKYLVKKKNCIEYQLNVKYERNICPNIWQVIYLCLCRASWFLFESYISPIFLPLKESSVPKTFKGYSGLFKIHFKFRWICEERNAFYSLQCLRLQTIILRIQIVTTRNNFLPKNRNKKGSEF